MAHYDLDPSWPVLGAVGGSLGAGVINEAIQSLARTWEGPAIQVLHLTGEGNAPAEPGRSRVVAWVQKPFEADMALFYAASDLVVARAGGGVAELTVTATPAVLIPGEFGSSGHQAANAGFLETAGAAEVLLQEQIDQLPRLVAELISSPARLEAMRSGAKRIAKPEAAATIADAMLELAQ
jgi:UDP-N-acetylglucosamine--N-acetylmuramyl-(pentapeptide) pyrophosphoryl-undecaprenol N-acetylglucosamine transferase